MSQDIASILERQAADIPERLFFLMDDVRDSYAVFNAKANRVAHGLRALGVAGGETVAVMMPNAPEFMYAWFGVLKLGAVEAPVNTAFRGQGLAHLLNLCKARLLVIDARHLDQLAEVIGELTALETVVLRGDAADAAERLPCRVIAYDDLLSDDETNPERRVDEFDRAMILFTSGTTGRSKGCVLSHRHLRRQAEILAQAVGVAPEDTLYCPFPLFHADATYLTVLPALITGARTALSERFSASRYWDEIRRYGATIFDFMGATLTILWKQPPRADDADNPARLAWGVPMPDFADQFEERFGLRLIEVYGLTDAGVGVYQPLDERRRPGACGKPIDCYDYRIFGARDEEMPIGEPGEIVVRPKEPGLIMDGYLDMPAETLATMRNLWLHTGDRGFFDADGYLHFLGRLKDSIRRRGENISSFEIEEAVFAHPAVLEVAAIGVPSELTEEDVMVWIVRRPGAELSAPEIAAHCAERMAAHMIPRYVRFAEELPKTPTEKIEKYKLREIGVDAETWDREATAQG